MTNVIRSHENDLKHFRRAFTRTPGLVVDADECDARLVTEGEANWLVMKSATDEGLHAVIVMDVRRSLRNFARLVGDEDREF